MKQVNHRSFSSIFLVLAICTSSVHIAAFGGTAYKMDRSKSYLLAITGKSGVFSFAAHEHAISATDWAVEQSIDPSNFKGSSVTVKIPVPSLVIDSAEARRRAGLDSGPGADDVRKIQQRMLGPEVLDSEKYPFIEFRSTSVETTGNNELRLTGQLQMHGRTQELRLPVRYVRNSNGGFDFSGHFTVKQTDFGMEPESIGLGTVKVKNEVRIQFQMTLAPAP